MVLEIGRHGAWTVENNNVVKRHCDYSCHEHKVSKVIKAVWEFWNLYEGQPHVDKHIILNYKGKKEGTYIEALDSGQWRLRFTPEIRKLLNKYDHEVYQVTFIFEKKGIDVYDVEAKVKLRKIKGNPLETIVEKDIEGRAEGKIRRYYTTTYERIPKYREAAIRANHGYVCKCCGFDFEKKYGELGREFIEVHHVVPLAGKKECVVPDVANDLVCLCPNCHRMIHRKKDNGDIYNVDDLKEKIAEAEKNI